MTLATFDRDAPLSDVMSALARDGSFIVRDFLPPDEVTRLNAEIEPELVEMAPGSKKAARPLASVSTTRELVVRSATPGTPSPVSSSRTSIS